MATKITLTVGTFISEIVAGDPVKAQTMLNWYAVAKDISPDLQNQEKLDAVLKAIVNDVNAQAKNAFRQNAKVQIETDASNSVVW